MAPLLILKLSLSAFLTTLEAVENFIPDGKAKDVLAQIDKYGKQLAALLGNLSEEELNTDDGDPKQTRAKLAKITALKGE